MRIPAQAGKLKVRHGSPTDPVWLWFLQSYLTAHCASLSCNGMWVVITGLKRVIPMQTAKPGRLSFTQILLPAPFPTCHPGDLVTIRKSIFRCRLFTITYLVSLSTNPAQWSSEEETGSWQPIYFSTNKPLSRHGRGALLLRKDMVSLDGWVMKCNATERKAILSFDRFLTAFEISPQASP